MNPSSKTVSNRFKNGSSPAAGLYTTVFSEALAYARSEDYRGWDYGDGMSSRIRQQLPFDNKWVNLVFQESCKRSPINIRPLLLVEQRRNYMGTALFVLSNLNAHQFEQAADIRLGEVDFETEAQQLVEWLIRNRSEGYHGFCGGHKHPIQHLDGSGHPNDPDVVSTSHAVKALLAASHLDEKYSRVAETAADFVVNDLQYRPVDEGAKINYHMNEGGDYYTINAGAIGARLFIDLFAATENQTYRQRAKDLLIHIATLQTDLGGWHYREPADASHLSMDNHHNAFILETYLRYQNVTGSTRFRETITNGLSFFRAELLEPTGAPKYQHTEPYPRDIHAAASSILLFVYAGDLDTAEKILEWTLANLYAGDGRFYYRKHRYYTKKMTLMRWAQAWMSFAISEFLSAKHLNRTHERFIAK